MATSAKATQAKGRGSSIPLEKEWLKSLDNHWKMVKSGKHPKAHGKKHNLIQFGAMLARETGRKDPFSESSLSRFLRGLQPSDEISNAFSAFFDLPSPLLAVRDPEEIEWFKLGRAMRDADHRKFEEIMAKIRSVVTALQELDESLVVQDQSRTLDSSDD